MAVPAVLDLPVGRDPVDLVGVLARGHRIPILVLREGHGHVTAFGLFRGLDDSVRSIVSASPLDVNLGHNGQALLPMMSASIVTSSRARIEPRVKLRIKPGQVDSISYGEEAHKRVGDIVALSLVLGPFALFGLLRHTPDHLVGIVYHTDDGKRGAVLLETPSYWAILQVLKTVTGKTVDLTP